MLVLRITPSRFGPLNPGHSAGINGSTGSKGSKGSKGLVDDAFVDVDVSAPAPGNRLPATGGASFTASTVVVCTGFGSSFTCARSFSSGVGVQRQCISNPPP